MFDKSKNGEAAIIDPELDRRPLSTSGHNIMRLDGSALSWRMGERLPFKFSNGTQLNLRPATFVVMGMLTKIAREHYNKIMEYNADSNKVKSEVNAQKIQVALRELGEIESADAAADKKSRQAQAITKAMTGGDGFAEAEAEKKIRNITYLSNDLNDTGMFKSAQYVFLDATDDKNLLRWKDEHREPSEDELNAALSFDRYKYEFFAIEIKDLFHVYYQLNFLPTVEKKSYLNLMIP